MMIIILVAADAQRESVLCLPCAGHFPCGTQKILIPPYDRVRIDTIILEEKLRAREEHGVA